MGAGGFEPPNANARGFTIRVYAVIGFIMAISEQ